MNRLALAIVAIAVPVGPAAAQLRLETGSGQSRLDQLPSSSLTSVGGRFDAAASHFRFAVSGDAQGYVGLGVAGGFDGNGGYRFAPAGWTVDVGSWGHWGRSIAAPWSSTAAGSIAVGRAAGPVTALVRWDQGLFRLGSKQAAWYRPTIGADFRAGAWQLGVSWQTTGSRSPLILPGSGRPPGSVSDSANASQTYDIHDVAVRAGWSGRLWSVNARAGRRFGVALTPEIWWQADAALRLTPVLSLTFNTGRLASDPLLASRGGAYTTAGVRLDLLHRPSSDRNASPPPVASAAVVRESAGTVHLYFVLPPQIRDAALSGDLTEWHSVVLRRAADGRWNVTLPALAGTYRINIRMDDGPWVAPPGLPVGDDGFGGTVGLIVIPE